MMSLGIETVMLKPLTMGSNVEIKYLKIRVSITLLILLSKLKLWKVIKVQEGTAPLRELILQKP